MINYLIHVAMAPLTDYVGTSYIIFIYHLQQDLWSHRILCSQHQCAKRTQHLKSVISILKNFVKNEYIFSIKEFNPDHSAIQRHCGLRLFSKLIKLYRMCTLFMYCKSRSFIVLLVILTDKEIPGAGNNAKVRTELTCSYVCW